MIRSIHSPTMKLCFNKKVLMKLKRFSSNESKNVSLCPRLGILGGGKMAEALINALNSKGVQDSTKIAVYDPHIERLNYLKETYDIEICESVQGVVDNSEIVILAVKPQHVHTVSAHLNFPNDSLLLSIVAGCPIKQLSTEFKTDKIVRSMPNTPAMILEGITVWTATKTTPSLLVDKTRLLLGSIGEQIEVSDESYLDMATAVSGSGPAYVFLVMEAMTGR